MAYVQVFASDYGWVEEMFEELPVEDIVDWTAPGNLIKEKADYFVFLLDSLHFQSMYPLIGPIFKKHPDKVIVTCMDEPSYEAFQLETDKLYTWWTMDLTQTIGLIAMRAKPFVNNSELEV